MRGRRTPRRTRRSSRVRRAWSAATIVAASIAIVSASIVGPALPAGAHPLGNFTVNRYSRVEVSAGVIRVHYVLDEAEIPAFQERGAVARDPAAFAVRRAEQIAASLRLTVGGAPIPIRREAQDLTQPMGQGGLRTLRLAVSFSAPLPEGAADARRAATFADGNEPDRVGWREIVLVARGNARILSSDAPGRDMSDELRRYPEDRLQVPLDRRSAAFEFSPGTVAAPAPQLSLAEDPGRGRGGGLAALSTRTDLTLVALAGVLALAVAFGALHALGPGHGKTIMAAYLVGTRGRARDALALAGVVSLMHTASVLVLGLVLLRVERSLAGERVYSWLTLLSGVVVTGTGGVLLVRRWRRRKAAMGDAPGDGHVHGHAHGGGLVDASPLSRAGLVALGASGGLFPSPSAVVVVVSTFSVGRAGLGLAVVGAFSIGLAATLAAVGSALVLGKGVLERHLTRHGRGPRLISLLPLAGAGMLLILGIVVTLRGFSSL